MRRSQQVQDEHFPRKLSQITSLLLTSTDDELHGRMHVVPLKYFVDRVLVSFGSLRSAIRSEVISGYVAHDSNDSKSLLHHFFLRALVQSTSMPARVPSA